MCPCSKSFWNGFSCTCRASIWSNWLQRQVRSTHTYVSWSSIVPSSPIVSRFCCLSRPEAYAKGLDYATFKSLHLLYIYYFLNIHDPSFWENVCIKRYRDKESCFVWFQSSILYSLKKSTTRRVQCLYMSSLLLVVDLVRTNSRAHHGPTRQQRLLRNVDEYLLFLVFTKCGVSCWYVKDQILWSNYQIKFSLSH